MITPLQLMNFINKGTYGNIYNTSDNTLVYKCYNNCYKTRNTDNNFIDPSILRELTFLKTLKNNNIIKINQVIFYKFQNDVRLGFTMPKYKSSLYDIIEKMDSCNIKYLLYKRICSQINLFLLVRVYQKNL